MPTAKLFLNGRSQAVRLPKEFRMPGTAVNISRDGNRVILEPIENSWERWFAAIEQFPDNFMLEGRQQPDMQDRDWSDQ